MEEVIHKPIVGEGDSTGVWASRHNSAQDAVNGKAGPEHFKRVNSAAYLSCPGYDGPVSYHLCSAECGHN